MIKHTFMENHESELYAIRLDEGPFKNVIFSFGKVNIREEVEDDQAVVSFDFRVEYIPKPLTVSEIETSEDFKNTIGDLLVELLEEGKCESK